MECQWCKGTGGPCGCGSDYCEHCNNGIAADPPYGPLRYLRGSDDVVITREQTALIDWVNQDYRERMRYIADKVSEIFGTEIKLSDEEVDMFNQYWDNMYRDETIGDVMQRIAMMIKDKMNEA
jgi:hypothetical protein